MKKIYIILKDTRFQEYVRKNFKAEKKRAFCHHNFEHLLSVARIAYILVLEQGLQSEFSKEMVYASALLHDIGRWKEYETGKDHALLSAEMAREILEQAGFERKDMAKILRSIKEHRGPEHIERTILGDILHRADIFSRSCFDCAAQEKCYKFDSMPTSRGLWY
ncbi:HD domain-containing protein [Candidatus Contubernalis alkaliaceticus]|uniref:HD domain-containing protein n=1 Tax=Candidatus Contubernalis alkaliaceticus TaxID=338645 RepID=UPI001F4C1E6D|nr:HD domain-containing protein [Candidatus Contubernalis alkalaceticus]UNC92961.1 HD domain-containing protein [Candidatus Contubernalis alkalaceticus]